jgi:hypothetical protein
MSLDPPLVNLGDAAHLTLRKTFEVRSKSERNIRNRITKITMKRLTLLLAVALLTIDAATTFGESTPAPGTNPPADSKKIKYTCPMHAEVVQDKPGKCEKCGMTLVEKKDEKPKG